VRVLHYTCQHVLIRLLLVSGQESLKRTGELIHLPAKENLRLDLAVFDGIFVKVLENDTTAGNFAL
jgi:pyrrolidone-carboxylate peptidase